MKKLLQKIAITLASAATLLAPVAAPVMVGAQADIDSNLCAGANFDSSGTCDSASIDEAKNSVNNILTTVINIFSLVVGVVSVIMIIVGGLKYITSGGESGNVSGAKNTILYAVIGLVVVALAQVIVRFVLAKVSTT
jgi:cytochrome bd-type quinol oxidase subunit 2